MTASAVLGDALAAHRAGLSVQPPKEDGTKAPDAAEWVSRQTLRATEDEVRRWYANGRTGLGVITGAVSGGLAMFEFEGRAVDAGLPDAFLDAAEASGLGELVARIAEGYTERTPSGGFHWLFRTEAPVTTKLANGPDRLCLIETKGEGGYTITAPSHGSVHPTGEPWKLITGGFDSIATITAEEQAELHRLAATFDQTPRAKPREPRSERSDGAVTKYEVTPGDDYNARVAWVDILEPLGWRRLFRTQGGNEHWVRPGKERGTSATIDDDGNGTLYVFTSSTVFEPNTAYSRFSAYAVLNHGGDFRAAALALEHVGYGTLRRIDRAARTATGEKKALEDDDDLRQVVQSRARRSQIDGASFVLDTPEEVQAVWGDGDQVAWSAGEPLLINGPSGVGKTTIAQQVTLARLGLHAQVLGLPVRPDDRRVLYIAADRPPQAARSMRRMVGEEHRQVLAERLVVWRGPLPYDLTRVPEVLATMAEEFDAGTVIIDSLKDVAAKLSEDDTGSKVNAAMQIACLAGVEVMALHHQRKRQQGAGKPKTLDDVYGSTWLTAGAGSVLLVWGEAGDAVVELSHLKQPVDAIGPLTLLHDHEHGMTTVQDEVDLLDVVRTSNGITAQGAARAMFRTDAPEANQTERARRRLEAICRKGLARREDPRVGGDGGGKAARYFPIDGLRGVS
ncbi:MAG: AAA family ATPase [Actinomycetota bacterium]|nr:AAA family ATPase [Actinomycetota bacterium]